MSEARESRPIEDEAAPEEYDGSEHQSTESLLSTEEPTAAPVDEEVGDEPQENDAEESKEDTVPRRAAEVLRSYDDLMDEGARLALAEGPDLPLKDLGRLCVNRSGDVILAQNPDRKAFGRTVFRAPTALTATQAAMPDTGLPAGANRAATGNALSTAQKNRSHQGR